MTHHPVLRSTVTLKVRSFLAAQGASIPPWSGLDETYGRLYSLMRQKQNDESFWRPLEGLLGDIGNDLAGRGDLPAAQAELLSPFEIQHLVRDLRKAVSRDDDGDHRALLQRIAAGWSKPVMAGFAALALASAGCYEADAEPGGDINTTDVDSSPPSSDETETDFDETSADGDADGDADSDSDTDADTDADSDADTDADSDADTDADTDADADECIDDDDDGWCVNEAYSRPDCDDKDPNVFPYTEEVPNNDVDDNCDGEVDCDDTSSEETCVDGPSEVLVDTLNNACLGDWDKTATCECFPTMRDDWQAGLEQLFAEGNAHDIAVALKDITECCRWEPHMLEEPYTADVEKSLVNDVFCNEAIIIYMAVRFGSR